MDQLLNNLQVAPLSLTALMINLVCAAALAAVLGIHYRYLGTSLAGRAHFARIFIFVALATTLIISIVKSSLALSLGLVGALSIVRFRTPVKEPEELAYLFMSIAIGLGLGADYRVETASATGMILALVGLSQWRRKVDPGRNLFVSLGLESTEGSAVAVEAVHAILTKHCSAVDLRRMDAEGERAEMTYVVDLGDPASIGRFTDELQTRFPGARITVIDQQQMPAV